MNHPEATKRKIFKVITAKYKQLFYRIDNKRSWFLSEKSEVLDTGLRRHDEIRDYPGQQWAFAGMTKLGVASDGNERILRFLF